MQQSKLQIGFISLIAFIIFLSIILLNCFSLATVSHTIAYTQQVQRSTLVQQQLNNAGEEVVASIDAWQRQQPLEEITEDDIDVDDSVKLETLTPAGQQVTARLTLENYQLVITLEFAENHTYLITSWKQTSRLPNSTLNS